MSDLIEYSTRADMVAGLLEFRNDASVATVEVVAAGRTLRVTYVDPDVVDETQPPVLEDVEPPAHDHELNRVWPVPVKAEETPAEDESTWDAETGTPAGEPVPDGEPVPAGEPVPDGETEGDPEFAQKIHDMTVVEIEEGITDGSLDADKVYAAENAGRKRKGVLALAGEDILGTEHEG